MNENIKLNHDKFWLENLGSLLNSIQVIPYPDRSLEEQLNAITRLTIIIGVILWLFDFQYGIYFLVISLLFLIIIYYLQKNKMQNCKQKTENYAGENLIRGDNIRENFEYGKNVTKLDIHTAAPYDAPSIIKDQVGYKKTDIQPVATRVVMTTGEALPFCNDFVSVDPPGELFVGLNQNLATNKEYNLDANPVTKIKPVVAPPAYDLESWRDNNLITWSIINSPGIQQEMYLSGYAESSCCGYVGNGYELIPEKRNCVTTVVGGKVPHAIVENYGSSGSQAHGSSSRCPGAIISPFPAEDTPYIPTVSIKENYGSQARMGSQAHGSQARMGSQAHCPGAIISPFPAEDTPYIPTVSIKENYKEKYPLGTVDNAEILQIQPNRSGWVNTVCGYNPEQTKVGLPSNFPAGNCEQDPAMKQYNENLFTQIVTPGVYTRNQVNEPINSNIGISFTQQFEPVTEKRTDKGLEYLLHDPRIIEPAVETPSEGVKANYDNVYDPRFYGYGTSYRSYLEPITGQTRFMYEDVNAIRMPNYITRSKIDHLPYADSYGPMQPGSEYGNEHNPYIRALAQDSWFRDSVQFRDDLQQRLMRKIDANLWQKRMYPNSSRPVGSSHRVGR